jgi:hypothetical protein
MERRPGLRRMAERSAGLTRRGRRIGSGRAGGLSFPEMEREIHEQSSHHANKGSEGHGMLIRPVREDPRDTCSESTERDHEKHRPHRGDRSTRRQVGAESSR